MQSCTLLGGGGGLHVHLYILGTTYIVRERNVVCRKEFYERKARKILHLMDLSITDIDEKLVDSSKSKDSKCEQQQKMTRHAVSNFLVLAPTVFTVFSKVVTYIQDDL